MTTRQKIRDFLDGHDGPAWSCEIVAATGCRPSTISGMVLDGALVKHTESHPHSYSVGIRPAAPMTPEQRKEARRATEAKRAATRNEQRKAERRARGIKARPERRQHIVISRPADPVGGETVSEFLARGGRIDRLPGIQKSNVYQPRRPVMASYRSIG